ncbi:pilus assembly protein TadG-related protein [Actinoplanes sp. NPDC049265]|uniref:pilus assembly protein TadG-related protein n=1 Tax=Actinoplanes sp. NPDC049265 TaxID=3363902 RepID=UPI00371F7285
MRRLSRRDDDGAVAVLVAILLGGGVLLGTGALVIDIGLIAHEREQLQGGADAAAWVVADSCVRTPATCAGQQPLAQRQADGNARDGRSAASLTVCTAGCGSAPRGRTQPCPALPPDLTAPFAEVRTETRDADGGTLLPPVLAGARNGTTVASCAQVAWGAPATGTVLALGIAQCAWADATRNGTAYPSPSGSFAAGGTRPTSCGDPIPSGWQATTGYTSLAEDDGCERTLDTADTVPAPADPGDCASALDAARDSGEPVLMAITDATDGTDYRISGFAAFVVEDDDPLTGHFEQQIRPVNGQLPGDGRDYGATYITRIG